MISRILVFFCLLFAIMTSCRKGEYGNYYEIPTVSEGAINAVIEIPAGTNAKLEYDPASNKFLQGAQDERPRVVRFLPYPGNYGFIPSTYMDTQRGGDGDPLDVLVISESVPTGTVQSILPIGVLRLKDEGELDAKIIAVPADSTQQVLPVDNFRDFLIDYDPARLIIEEWFLSYKGLGKTELLGWEDEQYAKREIRKWMLKQ